MSEVKWIKLNVDMFDHHKIRYLRRLPEGNNIILVWIMLLTLAGRCNSGGMIFLTESIPYSSKMLADELDFKENTVNLALAQLEQLGMIYVDGDFFVITNWNKYQNLDRNLDMREYNRIAQQRSRNKRKSLPKADSVSTDVNDLSMTVNDNVNDVSMTCQPCQTTEERRKKEEEEESKREEEETKDLEFHSINHSCDSEEENYLQEKISESGLEGDDAEVYKAEIKESLKLKYLGGTLGHGVVLLSEVQLDNLLDLLSLDEFHKYVEIVANNELRGHHYKKRTHYQAILDMVNKDRRVAR